MATETQRTQVPFESREGSPDSSVADPNAKGLSKADAELADRLAHMINETVERLAPMLKMIRKVCIMLYLRALISHLLER